MEGGNPSLLKDDYGAETYHCVPYSGVISMLYCGTGNDLFEGAFEAGNHGDGAPLKAFLTHFDCDGYVVVPGSFGQNGPQMHQSEPSVAPIPRFDIRTVLEDNLVAAYTKLLPFSKVVHQLVPATIIYDLLSRKRLFYSVLLCLFLFLLLHEVLPPLRHFDFR